MIDVEELLRSLKTSATADTIYTKIASYFAEKTASELFVNEYEEISSFLDRTHVQESVSVRNVLKARELATLLVSDTGELKLDLLPGLIETLKNNLYSFAENRHHDIPRDEHILHVLEKLQKEKELQRLIRNMTRPSANRLTEDLIRDTLRLQPSQNVTDAHARRAVLAAWFTYLRQSLGSCFASAPAIMIQKEYPALFLKDLDEMMNTGRMKKTFGGVEYSVPVSASWGNGDLKRPIFITKEKDQVWQSPGLVLAFDAVGLFPAAKTFTEKQKRARELLAKAWGLLPPHSEEICTNAEELIEIVILYQNGLTQKMVQDYLHKPKSMVTGGIMMHVPKTTKFPGSKKDPFTQYLKDIEIAKNGFKTLSDCALLKAWEFTLASFAEIKLDFARFNLYTSLGVNFQDVGGMGQCLYRILSKKVENANLDVQEEQEKYDLIIGHVRYLETRLRQASTESEIEWVKGEYQARKAELYHYEALRNDAHRKAQQLAHLYEFLIDVYDKKFFDYFQEVYDAEIHDIAQGPFDDSPAGFRLLYKHGRTNPSQWTRIFSREEFVEALASFFTITESEILAMEEVRGIETEISYCITELVNHIRSDEFLESALFRMAAAHGSHIMEKPLEHLDEVEKKPWVYTSGGSMSTLVSAYFRRSDKPTEVERWVESETELLAFLLDSLKGMPAKDSARFIEKAERSMLIHSPTHAFLLKPGFSPLVEGWKHDIYPYTWIKKSFVEPSIRVQQEMYVDQEDAEVIVEALAKKIPANFRPRFKELFRQLPYRLPVGEFRSYVYHQAESDRGMRAYGMPVFQADDLDELLFQMVPFTPVDKVLTLFEELAGELFSDDTRKEKFLSIATAIIRPPYERGALSANRLRELALTILILTLEKTKSPESYHEKIVTFLRRKGRMMPMPLFFADTNWVKDYFAFVVHPTSATAELWSVDYLGVSGRPISSWKMWLNGSRRSPQWGIFSKPNEYTWE